MVEGLCRLVSDVGDGAVDDDAMREAEHVGYNLVLFKHSGIIHQYFIG